MEQQLSAVAQTVLVAVARNTMADATLALANYAGGSRERRQGLAELLAAEIVICFTNRVTARGHTCVRVTKKGRQVSATLGIVGHDHAGYFKTELGPYIHTA